MADTVKIIMVILLFQFKKKFLSSTLFKPEGIPQL